jgi:hypothetical protein
MITDENLLRNNKFLILAAKYEGMDFKEMDSFYYRDGIFEDLRDSGYRIFFGFKGMFVIDDNITIPTRKMMVDLEELVDIYESIKPKNKPSRL